jgi:hypothetical protein
VRSCIYGDVEEGDGPTGIPGELFHEEDITRSVFSLKVMAFSLFELLLNGSVLIKEQNAEGWLWDHFQCPFFSGEHLSKRIVLGSQSHLLDELIDDFWV